MARAGVRAKISSDKKTITTWTRPLVSGQSDKLTKMSWKNYCISCKTNGTLELYSSPNRRSPYYDGAIQCSRCGRLYCGVTGWTEERTIKLIPATRTANEVSRVALSEVESDQCTLSRASALTKAQKKLKTTGTYKGTLEIPVLPNIRTGDRLQVQLPEFTTKTSFIDSIKEDIDKQTYKINLIKGTTNYGSNYSGQYIITKKNGDVVAASSKNPLKAKCTTVNTNTGIKANTETAKRIMLKGRALGKIDKIYKWLKVGSGGGTGGWKYLKYGNHNGSDSTKEAEKKAEEWDDKAATTCWKMKKANCCDFAWIFFMMCRGAGINVGIKKGKYTTLSGQSSGHMWNYFKSKNYDCSNVLGSTIDLKKVEKVK